MHAGVIAAQLANLYRKKGRPPLKWDHYFPTFDTRSPEPMHWRDMLGLVEALNAKMGGEDKRHLKKPRS